MDKKYLDQKLSIEERIIALWSVPKKLNLKWEI